MQLIDLTQFEKVEQNAVFSPIMQRNQNCWLQLTRNQCMQKLQMARLDYIHFARWLAIPSLNLMLVFKKGICCHVEQILV